VGSSLRLSSPSGAAALASSEITVTSHPPLASSAGAGSAGSTALLESETRAGDSLSFVGSVRALAPIFQSSSLMPQGRKFLAASEGHSRELRYFALAVARDSPLAGKSLAQLRFFQRFGAVVLAV